MDSKTYFRYPLKFLHHPPKISFPSCHFQTIISNNIRPKSTFHRRIPRALRHPRIGKKNRIPQEKTAQNPTPANPKFAPPQPQKNFQQQKIIHSVQKFRPHHHPLKKTFNFPNPWGSEPNFIILYIRFKYIHLLKKLFVKSNNTH